MIEGRDSPAGAGLPVTARPQLDTSKTGHGPVFSKLPEASERKPLQLLYHSRGILQAGAFALCKTKVRGIYTNHQKILAYDSDL